MKKIIALLIVLLFPLVVFADPYLVSDPQCKFQNDGCANGFEISWDGGITWQAAGAQDTDPNQIRLYEDLAGLDVGTYNIQARAKNPWGVSSAVPFSFTKQLPQSPINIQLGFE